MNVNKKVNAVLQCSKLYIQNVTGICLDDSTKIFYVVSDNALYNNVFWRSTDGVHFSEVQLSIATAIKYKWKGITYSPKATYKLCAIAEEEYCVVSNNGINWRLVQIGSIKPDFINWIKDDELYVAVDLTNNLKATSSNAANWTITPLTATEISDFNNTRYTDNWNVNTAVADYAVDYINIDPDMHTPDSSEWYESEFGTYAVVDNTVADPSAYVLINFDQETNRFIITYPSNNNYGLTTILNDAQTPFRFNCTWVKSELALSAMDYSDILGFLGGISGQGNNTYHIQDYDWRDYGSVGVLSAPVVYTKWVNTLGAFYAITADGQTAGSTNLHSWTAGFSIPTDGSLGISPTWHKLCFSIEMGVLIAVSSTDYPYIAVSNDGRNWRLISLGDNYAIADVISISDIRKVVLVTNNSNKLLYTEDLINWTISEIDVAENGLRTIDWISDKALAVVASNNRAYIHTSSDLDNWSVVGLPTTNEWLMAKWLNTRGILFVVGITEIIYTNDFETWEIERSEYSLTYPLQALEIPATRKCAIINNNTGEFYYINLNPSGETGLILNERAKGVVAKYFLSGLNKVKNSEFINNTYDNWSIIGNIDNNIGIRTPTYNYNMTENSNFITISNYYINSSDGNNKGIITDIIEVEKNSSYNFRLVGLATKSNCYVYIYGINDNTYNQEVIAVSNALNVSSYKEIALSFVTLNYDMIQIAVKFVDPERFDLFSIGNVQLVYDKTEILDYSQFKNNGIVYNAQVDFDGPLGYQCVKLGKEDNSYIEIKQPYITNDRISIAFWAKFYDFNSSSNRAIIYSGTEDSNFKIYINTKTHELIIEILREEINTGIILNTNKWIHIGVTYSLTKLKVYTNGVLNFSYIKNIDDFDDLKYTDSSFFVRFGALANKNDTGYFVSDWDGISASTSWYLSATTNNYVINSASDFAGFAHLVNTGADDFSDSVVTLGININLSNLQWKPIGYYNKNTNIYRPFKGIFNGNNKEITGLLISAPNSLNFTDINSTGGNFALFGYVDGSNQSVMSSITGLSVVGTITSNIDVSNRVDILSEDVNTAGIIAKGRNFKISDCTFSGSIISNAVAGGVAGDCSESEFYSCENFANIISTQSTCAGIVGYLDSGKIIDCKNYGKISVTTDINNNGASGIVGYFYGGDLANDKYYEISNCKNTGEITAFSSISDNTLIIHASGIVGYLDNLDAETRIQGCENIGQINGIAISGGIIGEILSNEKNLNIYENINSGKITGISALTGKINDVYNTRYLGGIIGCINYYNIDWIQLHGCLNYGVVTSGEYAGGILGINKSRVNIYNCINIGDIINNYNSAGILSDMNNFGSINNCVNIGTINIKASQFQTYLGAILALSSNPEYIINSGHNIYLNKSISSNINIFDIRVNAVAKLITEITNSTILMYLNDGENTIQTYKYIMDYDDGLVNYSDVLAYIGLTSDIYPLPEEVVKTIVRNITIDKTSVDEYSSIGLSLCDINFFDYIISEKEIRDMANAKIIHFKCTDNAETNTNFIPSTEGTYTTLLPVNIRPTNPDPIVTKFYSPANIYGHDVWKITFPKGTLGSPETLVETDEFILPLSEVNSNFTFSAFIYSKNIEDIEKILFKFVVDNSDVLIDLLPSDEKIIDPDDSSIVYIRYIATTQHIANPGASAFQTFQLFTGLLLSEDLSIYIFAPQLENKNNASAYMTHNITGLLYDNSKLAKHVTLALETCPTYIEEELAYLFNPYKKIVIPNEYVKNSKSFTVSFWMKASTINAISTRFIIGRAQDFFKPGAGWHISIDKLHHDVTFEAQNNNGATKNVRFYSSNIFDWTHFTAVYDNGSMYTYKDGINISLDLSDFSMKPWLEDIIIGSNFVGDSDVSIGHMEGDMIRDIRIYNTALSAASVLEIYHASGVQDTTGNLYTFRYADTIIANLEPGRTINIDKKLLSFNGFYVNNNFKNDMLEYWPLCGTSKNYKNLNNPLYVTALKSNRGVKNEKSLRFNGNSSTAVSKSELLIDGNAYLSLAVWFKVNKTIEHDMCLIDYSDNPQENNAFSVIITTEGKIKFYDYGVIANFEASVETISHYNDSEWHYLVINIIRCKSVVIYVDNIKDASLGNYTNISGIIAEDSTPELSWYNEIKFNEPIEQSQIFDNKLYIKYINDTNKIYAYPLSGDSDSIIEYSNIFEHSNINVNIFKIDSLRNIIYYIGHSYDNGKSYIKSHNLITDEKKLIADGNYCNVAHLDIANNILYYVDRKMIEVLNETAEVIILPQQNDNILKPNDVLTTTYVRNNFNNDLITYNIIQINRIFDAHTTYDPTLYELKNNKVVWPTTKWLTTIRPTADYVVEIEYSGVKYTTYHVNAINLNTLDVTVYDMEHTSMITSIDVLNGVVYTADAHGYVKTTDATGKRMSCNLDRWINKIKISADNKYLYAATKNRDLFKMHLNNMEVIWKYSSDVEIINAMVHDNTNIYAITVKNELYTDVDNNVKYVSVDNKLNKITENGNLMWKYDVSSPLTCVNKLPQTSMTLLPSMSGRIDLLAEISVMAYDNNFVYVGSRNNSDMMFVGHIQDLKILNRLMTDDEMQVQYNLFGSILNRTLQINNDSEAFVYFGLNDME